MKYNNYTIIKGSVKYKGDMAIEEYFNIKKPNFGVVSRVYLQELIDTHYKLLESDAYEERKVLKNPFFYKFDCYKYENHKLVKRQKFALFKKTPFEWDLLAVQSKTFKPKVRIIKDMSDLQNIEFYD
jgi:hypothetical protein